jgi:translation initiation factor eIF-2B subunit delta
MFSHLPPSERHLFSTHSVLLSAACGLHPLVVQLGVKFFEKKIVGSHARCMAMLRTFDVVIQDHVTPRGKEFSRDILQKINPTINFLVQCRPLCDSMANSIKALKQKLTELDPSQPEATLKDDLCDWLETFRRTRLTLAQQSIADMVAKEGKIQDGDVVLTHATSGLMTSIVTTAFSSGKKFRVIVVGSTPLIKSTQNTVIAECTRLGIQCTYVMMNAVSYIMREATKVFLPAHALLANGYVMGRIGTAVIAMTAKAHNVPVLVPCETYKFSDRVQTDSFVFNELDDPEEFVKRLNDADELNSWQEIDKLTLINLVYDVTPPEFVDMVITEIGMIPCSSVPVVLRVTQASAMD